MRQCIRVYGGSIHLFRSTDAIDRFILRAVPDAIKPFEKLRKPSWAKTREVHRTGNREYHSTSSCPTERKKWLQVGFLKLYYNRRGVVMKSWFPLHKLMDLPCLCCALRASSLPCLPPRPDKRSRSPGRSRGSKSGSGYRNGSDRHDRYGGETYLIRRIVMVELLYLNKVPATPRK